MSKHIHDMIQRFDMSGHPELVTSKMLDILTAIDERIDDIDQRQEHVEGLADVIASMDADVQRLNMTDMDAFLAWRLGLSAWQAAKDMGGKFPHDTEKP